MSEKKKKPERKSRPHRTQTKQWVDPQNTEDAAGKPVETKKKKNIKLVMKKLLSLESN